MDDNTNPVVSPFSGTNVSSAPPADAPVVPPPIEPHPSQSSVNQPPWHAPSLPTDLPTEPASPAAPDEELPNITIPSVEPAIEPAAGPVLPVEKIPSVEPMTPPEPSPFPPAEPVLPPQPVVSEPSFPPPPAVEPSFPPPPPEKLAESPLPEKPKKSNVGKAVVLSLLFFILAVGGVFGYLTVQQGGLPFNVGKRAAGCPPASCSGNGYLCAGGCDCNWGENKGVRWHYKCVNGVVEKYNEFDSGCNGSCPGGTQPTQPPSTGQKCPGPGHQECDNLDKCNAQGGCDPACCNPNNNKCPSGQTCDIQNGNCTTTGYSCNDKGPGQHKECVGTKCVNVGGAGTDKCTSDNQCVSQPTTPPAAGCPAGYSGDPSCTAGGPQCKTDGGACCQKDGIQYCCYKDGNCYRGGIGNQCKDNGNGSITLTGPMSDVRVFKMVGSNVSCPFSSSNQQNMRESPVTLAAGVSKTISLDANECGQIDAVGFCGSCKSGCGSKTTPTPTPPTSTPTKGIEPCCTNLAMVKVLPDGTEGELKDLKVGDKIKVTITFSGIVQDTAVRIKKGGVKMIDKVAGGPQTNTWSYQFTIPAAGEYEVLGFVKVGGKWK